MYYAPTEQQIRNLGKVFMVSLEELPTLAPGTVVIRNHFVARVKERPVLSRKIFKCNVHDLKNSKTLAIMRFRPYKDAHFSGDREIESYMRLAVQSAIQTAVTGGFEQLRFSSTARMLEDVMIDSGFQTVTKNKIPGKEEFTYNGCKQLKQGAGN